MQKIHLYVKKIAQENIGHFCLLNSNVLLSQLQVDCLIFLTAWLSQCCALHPIMAWRGCRWQHASLNNIHEVLPTTKKEGISHFKLYSVYLPEIATLSKIAEVTTAA